MRKTRPISPLVSAIADLKEELALNLVKESMSNQTRTSEILAECQQGLGIVGERYQRQHYYLSGLVMAGEIFSEITKLLKTSVRYQDYARKSGKVLIGTVAGDIHDLGKNITLMLLESNNYEVVDIGVDIPAEEFLKQAHENQPDIIGLSGLITIAYDSMRNTINLLKSEGLKIPIIIGGSLLNENVCKYTGADYWVNDASSGLLICQKLSAK
jgi:methanogenic corrinoid protein MtbC1